MINRVKVAVSGAAGQIGYSLLFRIASGEVFGPKTKVDLVLLEVPEGVKSAEGTAMELEDCAYPCLNSISIYDNPGQAFDGINWALLVGSKPRGPGMERSDLLKDNGKIFVSQGKALEKAASDLMVCVVGNPCNTNALIAMHNAKSVPPQRFTAMTMLDENRAKAQLAKKASVPVSAVSHLGIWGNHSSTMVPNFDLALIDGKPCTERIADRAWLEGAFLTTVQKRGAAIIEARGKSSAASAANACIDHVKNFLNPTPLGQWFSAAVPSDGNYYGIPAGLIYSFPIRSNGGGKYEIVSGLKLSEFASAKIELTTKELLDERQMVVEFLS